MKLFRGTALIKRQLPPDEKKRLNLEEGSQVGYLRLYPFCGESTYRVVKNERELINCGENFFNKFFKKFGKEKCCT